MQAIRKLNNNAVVCISGDGSEVIALGKGIGFEAMPREIPISQIERTFYNIDSNGQNIMKDLPAEVILFSAKVMDIASNELPYELSQNAVLLMADHIAFAIERTKKNIRVKMPLVYDLQQMFPLEYKIGQYIVRKVQKEFRVSLPDEEIAGIAMNLINSKKSPSSEIEQSEIEQFTNMLEEITEIIENDFHIIVNRNSFDYARFATHMQYLFQRLKKNQAIDSTNLVMYKHFKEEFPEVLNCASHICEHIKIEWGTQLSEEEELYLMLHVNRICVKEGL